MVFPSTRRLRMGEKLADKIKHAWPDHDIDGVMPIQTPAVQLHCS